MDRTRLTITLKKSLLPDIDRVIDGLKIRNRSHAIEYLITLALTPKIQTAAILAGGQGVKMRPLTYEVPKSLIPVSGRPILEHLLETLRTAEVRNLILCTGHLGEKVKEYFGQGEKFGVKITYSQEKKPLGTGGALKMAKSFLSPSPFLVLHGDILVDINLKDLIAFHQEQQSTATIALTTSPTPQDFGVVLLRGNKILKFIKPKEEKSSSSQLINTGIYVFEPEIFNFFPKKEGFNLDEIFPILAAERRLSGFVFEGKWFDVSTVKNYERAIKEWRG